MERLLRTRYMNHLLRMLPPFFERNRTGDLMAKATNDLRSVAATAGFGMLVMTDSTIYLIVVLFAMGFIVSWKLTLAAILPMPIIAIGMVIYGRAIHKRYTLAQDAFGDMNDQVLESVAGVRVIRAYVQERADQQRFQDITDDVYRKNLAVAKVDALFEPTINFSIGLSYVIGLAYGVPRVPKSNHARRSRIVQYVPRDDDLADVCDRGIDQYHAAGNASLDRVNETLKTPPDVADVADPVDVKVPDTIQFKDVTFRYPTSTIENLQNISFTLQKGRR